MCANCLSQGEVVVAHVALAAAVAKAPLHRALADLGLVDAPDEVARDVRTVAFLRRLDVDPVDALGADVVARADARVAAGAGATAGAGAQAGVRADRALRWRSSAAPIGSHSLANTQ
jgi:hypothetical protein